MDMSEFQLRCMDTAMWDRGTTEGLLYATLGLAGEAGEVANKIKKLIRDHDTDIQDLIYSDDSEIRLGIASEVGDVLYYCMAVLDELDINADYVARTLLNKLSSRKARGVIQGSGDDR